MVTCSQIQVSDSQSQAYCMAVRMREQWMRAMGLGQDEIEESLRIDPPRYDYEERQIQALQRLRAKTPAREEIQGWTGTGN